jgi:hypothetical protein
MSCTLLRDYIFTLHARLEMLRRDISEDDIEAVLLNPEQSEQVEPTRCVYQSRLSSGDPPKLYLYRVFVDIDCDPPEVVTVYRTSKIEKYWR